MAPFSEALLQTANDTLQCFKRVNIVLRINTARSHVVWITELCIEFLQAFKLVLHR